MPPAPTGQRGRQQGLGERGWAGGSWDEGYGARGASRRGDVSVTGAAGGAERREDEGEWV